MSLAKTAAALIEEIGTGTVEDILPDMEDCTRAQVIKALQNARLEKLIECEGPGPRMSSGRGSKPATYRAIRKTYVRPTVASVWDLAAFNYERQPANASRSPALLEE